MRTIAARGATWLRIGARAGKHRRDATVWEATSALLAADESLADTRASLAAWQVAYADTIAFLDAIDRRHEFALWLAERTRQRQAKEPDTMP